MWFVFIFISALCAAFAMIASKLGVKTTDPVLAGAINSIVVVVLSWVVVFVTGVQDGLAHIDVGTFVFLALAGASTGGVSIANYCALKIGDVDTYTAVVRCSMVLSVVLSFILLGDPFTFRSALGSVLILAGSVAMIDRRSRSSGEPISKRWVAYMVTAIVLSSAATLLGKVGISGVDSNLGTAIFSMMVFLLSNGLALSTGKWKHARSIPRRELLFVILAGIATAVMELTFYAGLQLQLTSIVMPVDKLLSGLFTVVMAYFVLGEKVNRRAAVSLCLIGAGTVAIL